MVLGGDLANVMRAVCVIHRESVVRLASVAKGRPDPPPSSPHPRPCSGKRLVGGMLACSLCEIVSAARVGAVECRRCLWDVRKPSLPIDTESSSESEATASQRRIFFNGEPARVLRHIDGYQLIPPHGLWSFRGELPPVTE